MLSVRIHLSVYTDNDWWVELAKLFRKSSTKNKTKSINLAKRGSKIYLRFTTDNQLVGGL